MRKSSVLITGAGGEIGHGLIGRLAADDPCCEPNRAAR